MNLWDDNTVGDKPKFDEPWQAQVYAMAQVLIEQGKISPEAWAETLSGAIRQRLSAGAPDTPQTYFESVADALETVLALSDTEVDGLVEAWRSAYEATPHGQPVVLASSATKTVDIGQG